MPSPTGVTAVLLVLGLVSQAYGQGGHGGMGMNKPGTCPEVTITDTSECAPPGSVAGTCFTDSDCEGMKQKCCSDGCNLICMTAQGAPITQKGKPGAQGPDGEAVSYV
jgi:hypothetical protein